MGAPRARPPRPPAGRLGIAHPDRGEGPRAGHRWPQQSRDRRAHVRLFGDGQDPRRPHLQEDRRPQSCGTGRAFPAASRHRQTSVAISAGMAQLRRATPWACGVRTDSKDRGEMGTTLSREKRKRRVWLSWRFCWSSGAGASDASAETTALAFATDERRLGDARNMTRGRAFSPYGAGGVRIQAADSGWTSPRGLLPLLDAQPHRDSPDAGDLGWWDDSRAAWGLLIVDDHAEFRASARALLDADGFDVVGDAADGESALEAARDGWLPRCRAPGRRRRPADVIPGAWRRRCTFTRAGDCRRSPASGTIACAVRAMPSMPARP